MNKKRIVLLTALGIAVIGAAAAVIFFPKGDSKTQANRTFDTLRESVNETDGSKLAESVVPDPDTGKQAAGTDPENAKSGSSQEENPPTEETRDFAEEILEKLGIEVPQKSLDWDELKSLNKDIYAWLYVPDTKVDYPVLQHATDNSYYLNYNLDGSKGYPGCIYTENFNSKDFTDPHTVVYGHNMKDKTMFATLHNFEDKDFAKEDHYIFIYTEDKIFVYQVFAAYIHDNEHLLLNYDLSNEYVFEQYIKDIYKLKTSGSQIANIRDDIRVTKEDRIITLSTCTREGNSDYRFLVTGVLLNP